MDAASFRHCRRRAWWCCCVLALLWIALLGGPPPVAAKKLSIRKVMKHMRKTHNDSQACLLRLRGVPKTGTTWIEQVVGHLMKRHCANDDARCQVESNLSFERAVSVVGATTSPDCADRLYFSSQGKHTLPGAKWDMVGLEYSVFLSYFARSCNDTNLTTAEGVHSCVKRLAMDEELVRLTDRADNTSAAPALCYGTRFVVTFRDPRATVVSFCHYRKIPIAKCVEPRRFIHVVRMMLFNYRLWSMVEDVGRAQVFIAHYEDLSNDFAEQLRALNQFIGFPDLTQADIDAVRVATTPQAMAVEGEQGELHDRSAKEAFGEGDKVFRATPTGFLEDLSMEQQAAVNATVQALFPTHLLRKYGQSCGGM